MLRNVLPPLTSGGPMREAVPGASVNSSFTTFVVPSNQITGWRNGQIVSPAEVNAAFSQYYSQYRVSQHNQLHPRLNYDQYVVSTQSFIGRQGSTPSSYQFIRPHPSATQRAQANREQTIIQGYIRGYRNEAQFRENMQGLIAAARRDGLNLYGQGGFLPGQSGNQQTMSHLGSQGFVGVRGSALTGQSAQRGTTFREHGPFNQRSDLDIFIILPAGQNLRMGRGNNEMATPGTYPAIAQWAQSSQQTLGRDVRVMVRRESVLTNLVNSFNREAYIVVSPSGTLSHWVLPPGF
ncbi:hypothetical protein JJJ17_09595 [Paracoccus caeni]|uniref:Uncharacterized protein n=1 Tax=Paracoccus caeni TaxID=657651 RepID=A0A934SE18_9RHOB|nr:hypothetical protein [Paracoccus caeni]MBK4216177.1 hypothetical protein [Paracoccus caeni]